MTEEKENQRDAVIVLGMHRSGTSCLSGSLQQAGLFLGEVNESAPHNAKGNRENLAIMLLHDNLLRSNGGSWDVPPSAITWPAEHKAEREALIASYPTDQTWGFKDPRTLIVLDGWLESLPRARFVGTFRHPLAVWESLQMREPFEQAKALDLWAVHNRKLLDYQRQFGFDLVCFDWTPERYELAMHRIVRNLGFSVPTRGFSFFESALRVNDYPRRETLPEALTDIYRSLQEIADRNFSATAKSRVNG